MAARQNSEAQVVEVLERPQQRIRIGRGRQIYQNRYVDPIGLREMMIRVIVEGSEDDPIVVSVYRTSNVRKYWQEEPPA